MEIAVLIRKVLPKIGKEFKPAEKQFKRNESEKKSLLAYYQFSPSISSRQLTFSIAEPCTIRRWLARTGTRRELVACQYSSQQNILLFFLNLMAKMEYTSMHTANKHAGINI